MILKYIPKQSKNTKLLPSSFWEKLELLKALVGQSTKAFRSINFFSEILRHKFGIFRLFGYMSENKNLSCFFAGAFAALAFAPVNFFIAAIISFSIFFLLLEEEQNQKKIFWLGFCFGFGHFLAGTYWIAASLLVDAKQFAWLIPFALTLIPALLAAYVALFAVSYKFLLKKFFFEQTYQKILIFAFCWLVYEILRSNLFSGFPWNLLGYIWMFDPHFAQLGSVFGVYGLSVFAILVSLIPVLFWRRKSSLADKIFFAILVIFLSGNFLFGYYHIDDKEIITDNESRLRLVQANIKQEIKWDERKKYENFLRQISLTNSKNFDNVKAVIWSETSVPYVIDDNPELMHHLIRAVPRQGILITGGLRVQYADESRSKISDVWNSIFVISRNGVTQHYDKHHLVPFGEYVPLHSFLSFLFLDEVIDKITGGGRGFSEGDGPQTLLSANFSFSPLVCYEVIFSREVVSKKHFPDLLINLTNDAWFGNSPGPYQHFDMARMRAIEYGVPLIRVAGTGISALVDPFGRVVTKIALNDEGVVDVNLIKSSVKTLYAAYGYLPLTLLVLLMVVVLVLVGRLDTVS